MKHFICAQGEVDVIVRYWTKSKWNNFENDRSILPATWTSMDTIVIRLG